MKTKYKRMGLLCILLLAVLICVPAQRAQAAVKPGKILSAKVVGKKTVVVKAKIKKKVASSNKKYYLVKVNGLTGKPASVLAETPKKSVLKFKLDTADKANVISKFGIAVKKGKKLSLISNTKYVQNPQAVAANTQSYELPATKKGIHFASDANLDSKHTLVNINMNDLIGSKDTGEPYVYNGKTYYFTNTMQNAVRNFVSQGICVTLVVYMNWDSANKSLIYPTGREAGTYWYMLNTYDEKARETLEAAFCYLGEKFSRPEYLVSNWVLGNEVNSQHYWNHVGNLSFDKYVKAYVQAFKMFSDGIHTGWSNARIFVPLDNAWNIPVSEVGWNGKTFLTRFAKELKQESANTKWNLAYHAYSFPLPSEPYKHNQYVTKSSDSYYITPQNLKYLTDYIKKTYGSSTRIILSEQGYMASTGESAQAASIMYAYYMAEFNSMVDAYIIRCEYDDAGEVSQGYAMGLTGLNGKRRAAYKVYKYMDSPKAATYAKKYLKLIGAPSWEAAVPGYKASRFK